MKVPVREEKRIEVRQTSSEFESLMVPILLMYVTEKFKVTKIEVDAIEPEVPTPRRQLDWHQVFELLPIALQDRLPGEVPNGTDQAATKTFEFKLNLPSLNLAPVKQYAAMLLPLAKDQIRKAPKKVKFAGIGSVILLASLLIWVWTRPASTTTPPNTGTAKAPSLTRGTPNYPTILPSGKTINQLGGWVRISPPNRAPVYTFVDHINGTQVDVSEQPLPQKFQTDTNSQMYQLAENFGADSKLLADGTMVYVGTTQQGAQSVILTKDNLLVLIKSVLPIPNTLWVNYINSLQ